MPLNLHTIKPIKGAKRKKKRVGRGNASGHGTYSGRGLKGQKSRSGVSGLKRQGMKLILRRIPKKKGFKKQGISNQVVNLVDINKHFKDGDMINPKALMKVGLIDSIKLPIKILGKGNIKIKKIQIDGVQISKKAKQQIEKISGKVKVSPPLPKLRRLRSKK